MKKDIKLPLELADGMTLEEIGAIYILMALPHLPRESNWFIDEKLIDYLRYFEEEGIITTNGEDFNIEIDLTWL
jgi:hypothetical protein